MQPTLIHSLTSIVEPLPLDAMFPVPRPVVVELGSGDGSFLVDCARTHPEWNVIGVERLLGRIRKTDRKARRADLANVRLVRIEASYLLTYLLPPTSVQPIHDYFPDPWPKRRHENRRLVNPDFVTRAARALVPGGCGFLRTDDPRYFDQMQAGFAASSDFAGLETPADLAALLTDFERDFLAQGKATLRAAYRRNAAMPGAQHSTSLCRPNGTNCGLSRSAAG